MNNKVELYNGNSAVRIQNTRDGLELAFMMHAITEGNQWTRLEVSKQLLLLLDDAIQNYCHNLIIAAYEDMPKVDLNI
jgi:hypothetical protein